MAPFHNKILQEETLMDQKNMDDMKLDYLISQSENLDGNYWFSLKNQKYFAFIIAKDLLIDGMDVDEAVETAKQFVDTFYVKAIKKHAWKI
ncbi:hypothetical protein [Neptunicoccus sediminis]|uniref:hypothetical protein n=1 Tax=Neptunicoccus sediminis TaxID=1892596 RepID=UPI0012FF7129|nr:hypothetical protein [Neptunicoccus sediminis]